MTSVERAGLQEQSLLNLDLKQRAPQQWKKQLQSGAIFAHPMTSLVRILLC